MGIIYDSTQCLLKSLGIDRFAWMERTLTLAVEMPKERVRVEREERDVDGNA